MSELKDVYTVESAQDDIDNKCVKVKFKEALPPLKPEQFVFENITYNPELTISGCTFNAIPTRGILCTTDRPSKIFNNTFKNILMPDILFPATARIGTKAVRAEILKYLIIHFQKERS